MNRRYSVVLILALLVIPVRFAAAEPTTTRWTPEQANAWYAELPWLVGSNYLPSSAINQLEMWQADTFDPEAIDRELGWAAAIGCNTMRVFLHDLCWRENRDGFFERINTYLEIADKHKIRTMFVIFDGVWDPYPVTGKQREPRAGVHNSGWVQSPGRAILENPAEVAKLQAYVTDLLKTYGKDRRVLVWDLFNEPDNPNTNSYGPKELEKKDELAEKLVNLSFEWARAVGPEQPLTVGVWRGPAWDKTDELNLVHKAALAQSDVISFHDYGNPDSMNARIAQLKPLGRPLFCTEYMARGNGSTFEAILPILKEQKIAAYCWGLVDGKSQTKYPWETWQTPIDGEPSPWHHDIFRIDGTPYQQQEVDLIKSLTK